jgi:glutamyl-tRNA synthetase
MINGQDGAPLSKRNGSETIQALREQGFLPLAIINYLARLGHYYALPKLLNIPELAENFTLSHINTAPARHDNTHLKHWQKEAMLALTQQDFWQLIQPLVAKLVPAKKTLAFAELIQANILMPKEAIAWAHALFAEQLPPLTAAHQAILTDAGEDFFLVAQACLEQQPSIALPELLAAITKATAAKGKALFLPLRLALTGKEHGPELANILSLMGATQAKLRCQQALQYCPE